MGGMNRLCLICRIGFNPQDVLNLENQNTEPKQILEEIGNVLGVSSSIYQQIDSHDLPSPLLCSACSKTVMDAVRLQNSIKTLQDQLSKLKEIIKGDFLREFQYDQHPDDSFEEVPEVESIRKTFVQCWAKCEVRVEKYQVLPEETVPFIHEYDAEFAEDISSPLPTFSETYVVGTANAGEAGLEGEFGLSKSEIIDGGNGMNENNSADASDTDTGQCNVKIGGNGNFNVQKRRISNYRPVDCQICERRFGCPADLKRHLQKKIPCSKGGRVRPYTKIRRWDFPSEKEGSILKDEAEGSLLETKGQTSGIEEQSLKVSEVNSNKDEVEHAPTSPTGSSEESLPLGGNEDKSKLKPGLGSMDIELNLVKLEQESDPEWIAEDVPEEKRKGTNKKRRHTNYSKGVQDFIRRRKEGGSQEKNYKCKFCGRVYSLRSKPHFLRHVEGHNGGQDFSCKLCDAIFPNYLGLRFHLKWHERGCPDVPVQLSLGVRYRPKDSKGGRDSWWCKLCKGTFSTRGLLSAHQISEHGIEKVGRAKTIHPKVFKCLTCGKGYTRRETLLQHEETHRRKEENLDCNLCNAKFKLAFYLKRHIDWHKAGCPEKDLKERKYRCGICTKGFDKKPRYDFHMKQHENPDELLAYYIRGTRDAEKNLIAFECKLCEQKFTDDSAQTEGQVQIECQHPNCNCKETFPDLQTFLGHHKKVCTVKYWQRGKVGKKLCEECGKEFKSQMNLNLHAHRVHPKPGGYICQHCGRMFGLQRLLDEHLVSAHSTEKKYQCHVCGSSHKTQGVLKSHLRLKHSDSPDVVCEVCGKTFRTRQQMRIHTENMHSGAEPQFPCEFCGKKYKSKGYVKNHIRRVHKEERNYGELSSNKSPERNDTDDESIMNCS